MNKYLPLFLIAAMLVVAGVELLRTAIESKPEWGDCVVVPRDPDRPLSIE